MATDEITPQLAAKIQELADAAPLPPDADRERFVEGLRAAFRIYLRDRQTKWNDPAKEIRALWGAARRQNVKDTTRRLTQLSDAARQVLQIIGRPLDTDRLGHMLADPERQPDALRAIERDLALGGRIVEGRRRPGGKTSVSWEPPLAAPTKRQRPPRHEAEIQFVCWLQLAWLEAAGVQPALTADPRGPGPFARFVQDNLAAVGSRHVDAVGLINDVHAIRRKMMRRSALSGPKA